MTQNPNVQDDNPENTDENEETLAERSARLEAEAIAMAESSTDDEQDPLAPEPEGQLYGEDSPLDAGDDADGHVVILRLQKELEDANDKMVRAVAEAENIRRRSVKEREDSRKYAISGFSKDILSRSSSIV